MTTPVLTYASPEAARPKKAFKHRWSVGELISDAPVSARTLWITFAAVFVGYWLLYSSHWYPLSDSSLYLYMAKGLASGKPIDWTRQIHKSIRPMTPWLLSLPVRAGWGIGAMHVMMIVMMLGSLVLMYQTVRLWFNDRLAYWSMLLVVLSWWVFSNCFTIMTEPPFLVFMWGGLYCLTQVHRKAGSRAWWWLLAGMVLLSGAWLNRVAAMFLIPGVALAMLLMDSNHHGFFKRLMWAGMIAMLAGLFFLDYNRAIAPLARANAVTRPVDKIAAGGGILGVKDVGDTDSAVGKNEAGYRMNVMVGVTNPIIQLPTNAGRWVNETMAAGLVYPYRAKGVGFAIFGVALGLFTLGCFLTGMVRLAIHGYWWAAGLCLYFFPLVVIWGTRVKPRYMIPIAPVMFVVYLVGLVTVIAWVLKWVTNDQQRVQRRVAMVIATALMVISVGINGFTYGVEVYIRQVTRSDFYDVARQGAYGELVDICGFLRKNAPAGAQVYLNRGARRRIVSVMSGMEVQTIKREVGLTHSSDPRQFAKLWPRVNGAKYVLAFYEQKAWPAFHLPIEKPAVAGSPAQYWELFELKQIPVVWPWYMPEFAPDFWLKLQKSAMLNTYVPVNVGRDRTSIDGMLAP